jgi:myo-inositol-1(or 4)-monophosphatase
LPESETREANDLTLLIEAAKASGEIAKRFWRQSPEIWEKDAGAGPVTEADLAVNAMLESELRAARPDYGWLSEESTDDPARLDHETCFIIDPIDGTRAFIEGSDGFSHSLAIARGGQVTAAVVYLPIRDEIYTATAAGPAQRNGIPLAPPPSAPLGKETTIITSAASFAPHHWRGGEVPEVTRTFRSSLAWRLCLVAEGRFDIALSLRPAWEWDIAAGALIAARAGVISTDRTGAPLRFNRPTPQSNGLITAQPDLHRVLAAKILP